MGDGSLSPFEGLSLQPLSFSQFLALKVDRISFAATGSMNVSIPVLTRKKMELTAASAILWPSKHYCLAWSRQRAQPCQRNACLSRLGAFRYRGSRC